jgi:hypothetical protein
MAWLGGKVAGEGDGVVPLESARVDDAVSQIEVPAEHTAIHRHPRAILEVRRVLLEHLHQVQTAWANQSQQRFPEASAGRHPQAGIAPVGRVPGSDATREGQNGGFGAMQRTSYAAPIVGSPDSYGRR